MSDAMIQPAELEQLLRTTATVLRSTEKENSELKAKIAAFEKQDRADRLVVRMEERGLVIPGDDRRSKIASLLNGGRDLDVLEAVADLSAPSGGGFQLSDQPAEGGGDAADVFAARILS